MPKEITKQQKPTKQQKRKNQIIAPLGTIARANGKLQLTYKERPVYTYAFDRKSADDKGDGIGGVWHYIEVESVQ